MLRNTFIHIPTIGKKKERTFWRKGIRKWEDVNGEEAIKHLPRSQIDLLQYNLEASEENLNAGNAGYFAQRMPAQEHWRLFPEFRERTAYLDIETTGLGSGLDHITTIALYAHGKVRYYIYGDNLENFLSDVSQFEILVTYNGKCFDIPFIRNQFNVELNQVQIDLRYILGTLGYRGGLKGCEKQLGVDRDGLEGVDGYLAVLLWNEYRKSGSPKALETLLAYNIEDAVNLEKLILISYNKKVAQTPFCKLMLDESTPFVDRLFLPDIATIAKIKGQYFGEREFYV